MTSKLSLPLVDFLIKVNSLIGLNLACGSSQRCVIVGAALALLSIMNAHTTAHLHTRDKAKASTKALGYFEKMNGNNGNGANHTYCDVQHSFESLCSSSEV